MASAGDVTPEITMAPATQVDAHPPGLADAVKQALTSGHPMCPFRTLLHQYTGKEPVEQVPAIQEALRKCQRFNDQAAILAQVVHLYKDNPNEYAMAQHRANEFLNQCTLKTDFEEWLVSAARFAFSMIQLPESPDDPASNSKSQEENQAQGDNPVPMDMGKEIPPTVPGPAVTTPNEPLHNLNHLLAAYSKEQLFAALRATKPVGVSDRIWLMSSPAERRMLIAGQPSNRPTPFFSEDGDVLDLSVHTHAAHGTVKLKYSDKLYPPPEKFTGDPSGHSAELFVAQLRSYLCTQMQTDTPNEREWGDILSRHLGGTALRLFTAELAKRGGQMLSWSEATAFLLKAFSALQHQTLQKIAEIDALTWDAFQQNGGIHAFCHKFQELATAIGPGRSDTDHLMHLYRILPNRLGDVLSAKFDFRTPPSLIDALDALRGSRFALIATPPKGNKEDAGNMRENHGGRGRGRGRGGRGRGGRDHKAGRDTSEGRSNKWVRDDKGNSQERDNKRARHEHGKRDTGGNQVRDPPKGTARPAIRMLASTDDATVLDSNSQVSCQMPMSANLAPSVLPPHARLPDLHKLLNPKQPISENSQFRRIFKSTHEPAFDMAAPGCIAGQQVIVKLDSQADTSFLPAHIAAKAGVCLDHPDRRLGASVADGHTLNVYGIYECPFQMQGTDLLANVIVADLPGDILYLGKDWLTAVKARLDFGDGKFVLQVGQAKLTFEAEQSAADAEAGGISHVLGSLNLNSVADLDQRLASVNPLVGSLLQEFRDLFPETLPAGLPPDRGQPHVIELDPAIPVRPGYNPRHSPKEKAAIAATIAQLLELGLIEESTNPFSAPVLLVEKKDGTLRMVVDYRRLNSATVKNSAPLPRVDETLDELAGAKYFTSLDLHSGYHQLRIADEDVPKTSFKTHLGQFQFKVLPFGLSNAPATFQAAMNRVFAKYLHKFVVIYLDDIMIYSRTKEEHLQHLRLVLQLLRENRFFLKLSKCSFMQQWTLFLGFYVGPEGIKPDPAKIAAVRDWKTPVTVTEVRSFLGLRNFFSRFIQGFAVLAAPLINLTKKNNSFSWSAACAEGFQALKTALTESPVLQAPDPDLPFTLVTDASGFGMGAVLMQNEQPVAYFSKRFSPAEMNYSVSEQELCATINALKRWRHHLEGCKGLTIVTDHHPNTFFQGTPVLSRRQARWYELLQRFHFEWKYEPGSTNVADPLSRCPNLMIAVFNYRTRVLAALTRSKAQAAAKTQETAGSTPAQPSPPPETSPNVSTQTDTSPPDTVMTDTHALGGAKLGLFDTDIELLPALQTAYARDPKFSDPTFVAALQFADGFWWRTKEGTKVIQVPNDTDIRDRLIAAYHDSPAHGHLGVRRTVELIQRKFHWRNLLTDVRRFVASCDSCQRNKPDAPGPKGLLHSLQIADMPWSSLSFDFITCLPPTNDGNNALMVVVDRLTKMCRLIPCDFHCSAQDVAGLLSSQVFSIFGVPETLISDRDPRFTAHWFKQWARSLGVKQCLSSPYHPQTDGQTERMNRVVEDMLRHFVNPRGSDWDAFVPAAQLAINNAFQSSIKSSPFFLNFGRHPRVPGSLDAHVPPPPTDSSCPALLQSHLHDATLLLEAAEQRYKAWEAAQRNIAQAQAEQAKHYNKGRRDIQFRVGDLVLYSTRNAGLKSTLSRKLLPKWVGPFKVTRVVNELAYELEFPPQVKWHNVIHVSSLRRYIPGRTPPPPLPHIIDGEVCYDVEVIMGHTKVGKRKGKPIYKYLIKWEGYGPEFNSWEPESNLVGTCDSLLSPYKAAHGL